jgi:hypothetical protein
MKDGKPYSRLPILEDSAGPIILQSSITLFEYYGLRRNVAVIAGPLGEHNADEMKFWTKDEYSCRFIPTMANKPYSYIWHLSFCIGAGSEWEN